MPAPRPDLESLTKTLMNQGRLIEAGWVALRIAAVPPDAPQVQIQEMRKAFMAGAQHLFASIMTGLDEDSEPTSGDMRRMDLIAQELEAFGRELEREARGWPISP